MDFETCSCNYCAKVVFVVKVRFKNGTYLNCFLHENAFSINQWKSDYISIEQYTDSYFINQYYVE